MKKPWGTINLLKLKQILMGMEGPNTSKSPVQGEAGYLTQEQLDELNAPAAEEASQESATEQPEDSESDMFNMQEMQQTADALGGTAAPEAVEVGPEVMKEIDEQERKLADSAAETTKALEAAEAKVATIDPEKLEADALLKYRIMQEKIRNAYTKVTAGINRLGIGSVGVGAVTYWAAAFMHVRASNMIDNLDIVDGSQLMDFSQNIGGAGIGLAVAGGAALTLGHALNWLTKRSREKGAERTYENRNATA